MGISISGFAELLVDVKAMETAFQDAGAEGLDRIVKKAAEIIKDQAIINAPRGKTGDLKAAIGIGKKTYRRSGGTAITIGVHRKDWHHDDYYPAYVEFGHGGPHPALAHPYLIPAYNMKLEEVYTSIRDDIKAALQQKI